MPKKPKQQSPVIPRQELRTGALKCIAIAESRLAEAEALIEAHFESQAAVVFSFAVEELGKAVLLRQAYDRALASVTVNGFYEHRDKLVAAEIVIPNEYLRLTTPEFDPEEFSDEFAIGFTPVDVQSRWSVMFVNWDKGGQQWTEPVNVERAAILNSIAGVRRLLGTPLNGWPC